MVHTQREGHLPARSQIGRRDSSDVNTSRLAEHAMVTLAAPVALDDGRQLPEGARGAVVLVHGEGAAYMVEFIAPFHAIATIAAAGLVSDAAA